MRSRSSLPSPHACCLALIDISIARALPMHLCHPVALTPPCHPTAPSHWIIDPSFAYAMP
jgi:hypothetical protein